MRLLVTGTGRCGTQWIAAALTAAGVPCTHEVHWTRRYRGDGDWTAEASWPAAAYTPIADAYVVHLVRHPLAVIRSRLIRGTFGNPPPSRGQGKLARWATRQCPQIATGRTELDRVALHWTYWNQMVRGAAERIRLEDITPADVTRLARIADPDAPGVADLPPPVGAGPDGPQVTWQQVQHIPGLLALADEYGYR